MRSSHLISFVASAALAVPLMAVAPSVAEAAPSKPAIVETRVDKLAPTTTRDEAKRYAAAEQNAPAAADFSGGQTAVLIIGPTMLVLLAILLILL